MEGFSSSTDLVSNNLETVLRKGRYPEIDSLRGIAVVAMILFHLLFDLKNFTPLQADLISIFPPWFWWISPKIISGTFLCLVGVSIWIQYSVSAQSTFFANLRRRSLRLAGFAALITAATIMFTPGMPIYFGVIHCIAATTLLSAPFTRFFHLNLIFGLFFIGLGNFLPAMLAPSAYFFWLGLTPASSKMWDFFPILPYFGVVLIGLFLGRALYPKENDCLFSTRMRDQVTSTKCSLLGRWSLWIYIVHQPLIIGLLALIGLSDSSGLKSTQKNGYSDGRIHQMRFLRGNQMAVPLFLNAHLMKSNQVRNSCRQQ